MQPDPIQPFRDEIDRHLLDYGYLPLEYTLPGFAGIVAHCTGGQLIERYERSNSKQLFTYRTHAAYRAAKALCIAETEGPAAALLWKLAN